MSLAWRLFIVFFNIGAFTIGGGYAMVPLIKRDVADKNHWLTEQEFIDLLAVAQAAPGVLAINMALVVGYRVRGTIGAIAGALGAALPSFLIILVVASLWLDLAHNRWIEAFMAGARPVVVALLANAALSMGRTAVKGRRAFFLAVIVVVAVALMNLHPFLAIVLSALAGGLFLRPAREEGGDF